MTWPVTRNSGSASQASIHSKSMRRVPPWGWLVFPAFCEESCAGQYPTYVPYYQGDVLASNMAKSHQIQRLVIALGPTTQHHDGAIRLARVVDLLAFDQLPRFETRAECIQAEGLALPRRHGTRGGATRIGPARLLERLLEPRPVEFAIAQQHDLRTRGDQLADEGDQGDMQLFRKVPFRGVAHPPGQR